MPAYPLSFDASVHGLKFLYQGKTRETWGIEKWPFLLLMVMSKRLSTHNVVHKSLIPLKDQVLTALTVYWFMFVLKDLPHHLVAYGRRIYDYLPGGKYPDDLHLRSLIVRRLEIILVEFIWRAYLTGSLWKKFYSKLREGMSAEELRQCDPYGLYLPLGLPLMHRFDIPVFTPTEKSDTDDPLTSMGTNFMYPRPTVLTQMAFFRARELTNSRGIEIIDTKEEVGRWLPDDPDRVMDGRKTGAVLADEMITPDSSRFADLSMIKEGVDPPWYDKQISRDEAELQWRGMSGPPLQFSDQHIKRQTDVIMELFERIVAMSLSEFQKIHMN